MEIATVTEIEATQTQVDASVSKAGKEGKYLTFVLGDEQYGIEILIVREIIVVVDITSIPNVPNFVKGVVNLRGNIIPVIDLRLKFGMPEKDYDKETCIIVVNLHGRLTGIVVDTVSEVLGIQENEIDDPPSFGSSVETDLIIGMGKVKEKVIVLVNLENIISHEARETLALIENDLQETTIKKRVNHLEKERQGNV